MSLFGMYERRSVEDPRYPLSSDSLLSLLGGHRTNAGVKVSPRSALATSAVWRAAALISGVAAALPLTSHRVGTHDPVASQILASPNPELTPFEFWRISYAHRLLWGNSVSLKERDGVGRTRELWPFEPHDVNIQKVRRTTKNPLGKVFETTDRGTLLPHEVLHVPGLSLDGVKGLSVISYARQTVGLAQAAETYAAKLFGSGNLLSGVLQTDHELGEKAAKRLKRRWRERHQGLENAHDVGILDAGAKFESMTMPNSDAQFLESRQFSVPEIARFFGVPPFLLMSTEKSTSWGTGLEQQAIGWVTFDLHPQWLAPTEQRVTKHLLRDPQTEASYNVDQLMRGDSAARGAFYRIMREIGAFSANDVRERERLAPIEDGDVYLQPANLVPLGAPAPTPPAPTPPAPADDTDEGDDEDA